ncbi:MAG: division/cell wall cluster transcriptional repressor MraZ [Saprospiraceae bacterium]|nr:division/cell wall cluster transcriptional repressor MraZ [Saprospiraceae bacterium]MBK7796968.1 division/cell wall cluster transcriptional repressor MraZ [Saprospiraceae bacterium]MBK9377559.1 division/cell wall cluster transcriptional repressor MraZ [Saprospiraceae bacterium]MBL0259640.1 division/cell wall cluster transcriptional repressor MraZ [Saprospiraceae bacterium]
MYDLTGEFEVKLDDKSRLRLPAQLMKQLAPNVSGKLVLNRGFEKCLLLYPADVWAEKTKEVNQLNTYNAKKRAFVRYFYRGATTVLPDANDRILLSKSLMEHAGIDQEVILLAYNNQVEVWSKGTYLAMVAQEPENFSDLAEEIFGDGNG